MITAELICFFISSFLCHPLYHKSENYTNNVPLGAVCMNGRALAGTLVQWVKKDNFNKSF